MLPGGGSLGVSLEGGRQAQHIVFSAELIICFGDYSDSAAGRAQALLLCMWLIQVRSLSSPWGNPILARSKPGVQSQE